MSDRRVQMNVPVPAELKAAIRAEAVGRGVSTSDAAVERLASVFGVEYEAKPSSKVVPEVKPNETKLTLVMPERLRRKINSRAGTRGVRPSALAASLLAEAFADDVEAVPA